MTSPTVRVTGLAAILAHFALLCTASASPYLCDTDVSTNNMRNPREAAINASEHERAILGCAHEALSGPA